MCGTSYCSCKSACSSCHLTNNIIYFINDVIKHWLTPAQAKENKETLKQYYQKIDSYSMMEYLTWIMDEEKFQEALENFQNNKVVKKNYQKSEVVDTTWRVNPNEMCFFPEWCWPWGRCIYCNSIKREMKNKKCPKYIQNQETLGSTVVEN